MLRQPVVKLVALAAVFLAAPLAQAQQDPEPEKEERSVEPIEDVRDVLDEPTVPAPIELRWQPKLAAKLRAGAGAVSGDTINPGTAALSIFEGVGKVLATRGRLTLEVPWDFRHRQTFGGASLTEAQGRAMAVATYRFTPRIRVAGEVGVSATWKPDWQDPFQDDPETGLIGNTDRYSHWDRRAGLETVVRPFRRQRLRIAYDYTLAIYKHDPMFDAIYDPIHLTPWDRDTHRLDAVWRIRRDRLKFRLGAEVTRRKYFFVFAGDSKTGVTHAGPGGEPPNPLLELRTFKPRIELDVEVHPSVVVQAQYELEVQRDMYERYLSFVGHHPELRVIWALPREAEMRLSGELFLRKYGSNSYDYQMMPDDNHPALAWGDRRAERLGNFGVQFHLPLAKHWAGIADGRMAIRRTNYTYSIDWNYTNWLAWAGAEYRY